MKFFLCLSLFVAAASASGLIGSPLAYNGYNAIHAAPLATSVHTEVSAVRTLAPIATAAYHAAPIATAAYHAAPLASYHAAPLTTYSAPLATAAYHAPLATAAYHAAPIVHAAPLATAAYSAPLATAAYSAPLTTYSHGLAAPLSLGHGAILNAHDGLYGHGLLLKKKK